jgi:hypothetical protein
MSAAPGRALRIREISFWSNFDLSFLQWTRNPIGSHPIVIITLCEPLDFGCAASIIRAKLHRVGRGSKQNGNGNWRG